VTRNDRQRDRGSSRLAAARRTRSVVVSWGRRVCRVPGPHHPHPLDRRQRRRTRRFPHRATQPNRRRRAESHPAALSRPQRGHDTTIADALSTSCHYSGSRSMRNVNGLVASALDADKQSPRQKLPWLRTRRRSLGSSSSTMCAVPGRQRIRAPLRSLTRTRGSAWMLRTNSASRPVWAISQNVSPSWQSHTGVRRGFPVVRPVVSNRASPGAEIPTSNPSLTSGFTTNVCTRWTACFIAESYVAQATANAARARVTGRCGGRENAASKPS
jgi:hypothetical protein